MGEFGGGVLTALGFLNPIGPIAVITMMILATIKGHWGKPIWASKGGAELAVTFLAGATAVALDGPGQYSLDSLLGIKLPRWLTALSVARRGGSDRQRNSTGSRVAGHWEQACPGNGAVSDSLGE